MKCQAIKENLSGCKCNAAKNGVYCSSHRGDAYQEHHKGRWWKKYILGNKNGLYFFEYERKGENRIYKDLTSGHIKITPEDVASIPPLDRYIDIFAFLCLNNWAKPQDNERLWRKSMLYVITQHLLFNIGRLEGYRSSVNDIQDALLTSPELFTDLMDLIAYKISSVTVLHAIHLENITQWMNRLLELDIAKKISWMNKRDVFYATFSAVLGTEHILTKYMDSRFLPEIRSILRTEMGIQKAKMFHYKEELVAKAWHPRRLELYLNMGYPLDDVLEETVDATLDTKCNLQEKSTLYKHISLGDM
jgi:hypothetical protein